MTILDLKPGQSFVIQGVNLNKEIGKRLSDMGFTQGVEGRVVRKAFLGDPLQIAILGYQVSIRRAEAAGVSIQEPEGVR